MIEVFKTKIIQDEKERENVLKIIFDREKYYINLFKTESYSPRIKFHYESVNPWSIRILFSPGRGEPTMINVSGYGTVEAVTKHALKKLRRVAKNYFVKIRKNNEKNI